MANRPRLQRWNSAAALLALAASLPCAIRSEAEAAERDVLAGAFEYPFMTDAEVEFRLGDREADVRFERDSAMFRYPGIQAVFLDGQPAAAERLGPDLLRIWAPEGTRRVLVSAEPAGKAAPAATADAPGEAQAVASPEDFARRAKVLRPGDTLVVRDGTHENWTIEIAADGAESAPITVRPQTPGGAIFTRGTEIAIRGRWIVFRGFRFDQCGPATAVRIEGSDCRLTQCAFARCGNPASTFGHIVSVDMDSHRNRVDHCYFTGSKSMSLGQTVRAREGFGVGNRFDHNLFRDIFRHWTNGQENIQLGQNQRDYGRCETRTLVECNVFDNAWGDSEIVSNKSAANTIRWNVAAHCRNAGFTMRGGVGVRFEGNAMWRNHTGVRVMGEGHAIVNNWIREMSAVGIALVNGGAAGELVEAAHGVLAAHNTILDCEQFGIASIDGVNKQNSPAFDCRIVGNLVAGRAGTLLGLDALPDSDVRRNLLWAAGKAETGGAGEEAILADPMLEAEGALARFDPRSPAIGAAPILPETPRDRWNRLRDAAPDIGADEFGAPEAQDPVALPPFPAPPRIAPERYRGAPLFEKTAFLASDSETALGAATDSIAMAWEYAPASFSASAALKMGEYALRWGGIDERGLPRGVVKLEWKGKTVADGADVLYPYQQFKELAAGSEKAVKRFVPNPDTPYRFALLKRQGRIVVLLDKPKFGWIPILAWENPDPDARGSSAGLRLRQSGEGRWSAVRAWALAP